MTGPAKLSARAGVARSGASRSGAILAGTGQTPTGWKRVEPTTGAGGWSAA